MFVALDDDLDLEEEEDDDDDEVELTIEATADQDDEEVVSVVYPSAVGLIPGPSRGRSLTDAR